MLGKPPLRTRWLDHNKGDSRQLDLRSRLVVQETKRVSSITADDIAGVFSATPPLEALRFLFSLAMSLQPLAGLIFVVRFLDVSRAHPHCVIHREVFIRLPSETGAGPDQCGLLRKNLYGTRDANQNFEFLVSEILTSYNFVQGVFNPCLYVHIAKQIYVYVHGDDFVVLSTRTESLWLLDVLRTKLIVKDRGCLGPSRTDGDVSEIRCLNRTVRWVSSRSGDEIQWEADARHAQLIIADLGLKKNSKSVVSPGTKSKVSILDGPALDAKSAALFKSICMRIAFLALDRPDIAFSSKECTRAMSCPTHTAMDAMKRLGRYLMGKLCLLLQKGNIGAV